MYHVILLPATPSELELVLLARTQWRANRLETCLVTGADRAWVHQRRRPRRASADPAARRHPRHRTSETHRIVGGHGGAPGAPAAARRARRGASPQGRVHPWRPDQGRPRCDGRRGRPPGRGRTGPIGGARPRPGSMPTSSSRLWVRTSSGLPGPPSTRPRSAGRSHMSSCCRRRRGHSSAPSTRAPLAE